MNEAPPFLSGRFLLAMPGIGDPRFERSVIAVCSHDGDGALGIGIGGVAAGLTLHDLMRQLDVPTGAAPDIAIHLGGPCEPQRGFVLHSTDWGGEGTIDVAGRWALSASLDVLRAIGEGRGPRRFVVALGYAGWSGGQLDGEMTRHGWFPVDGSEALMFDTAPEDRWAGGFATAGIDVRLLASASGTA